MSAPRKDIQALRALAVLLVVAFHVHPAAIPGGYVGVDVFFVISGYLITGHLLREVASTGHVHVPNFYARRARRLLPAASLTLVTAGLATYLWMPAFTWPNTAADMAASALYAENWALLRRSVDYLALDEAPSPLQHFWSLAVEEQFYLGWPLVVAGVAAWWKKRRGSDGKPAPHGLPLQPPPRRAYALPMGALSTISFACSLYYARTDPAAGYFMTHVRLFELGLGGLLGVYAEGEEGSVLPPWLASRSLRTLTAAAGLAAIGASAFTYTTDTPFPGTAALVPVLGAAAFLAAGEGDVDGDDTVLAHALVPPLAHPWLQYVGDISYSLYLAHWPVVVVYPFATGRALADTTADRLTVGVTSWALAHACKRGWEDRFRWVGAERSRHGDGGDPSLTKSSTREESVGLARRRFTNPMAVTLGATILTTTAVLVLALGLHALTPPPQATGVTDERPITPPKVDNYTASSCRPCPFYLRNEASNLYPGADAALYGCSVLNSLPISKARPDIAVAKQAQEAATPCSSLAQTPTGPIPCVNDSANISRHEKHVVLIGDSHAAHFGPTFDIISKRVGFRFTLRSRSSCPPTLTVTGKVHPPGRGSPDVDCHNKILETVAWVLEQQPSVVVLSAHNLYHAAEENASDTALGAGVVQVAKQIVDAGIPVLGLKGTPTMAVHGPECLAQQVAQMGDKATNISACTVPRSIAFTNGRFPGPHVYPIDEAARMYPILRLMSLDDILCPGGICLPIIGNVIVYRDRHHLTVSFAKTLANALERKLLDAAPHLKPPPGNSP